jgi:hypothetical protein
MNEPNVHRDTIQAIRNADQQQLDEYHRATIAAGATGAGEDVQDVAAPPPRPPQRQQPQRQPIAPPPPQG